MRSDYIAFIKYFLLLAIPLLSMAGKVSALQLDSQNSFYNAKTSAAYLEDKTHELDIETIENLPKTAFSPISAQQFTGGYSDSSYWIRLPLYYHLDNSESKQSHDWVVEIDYAALDYVDVYYRADGTLVHHEAGDRRPLSVRGTPNNFHVFYLRFPANVERIVYLRVQTSSSLQVPLNVWSPGGIYEERNKSQLGFGLYIGVLLIMAAYNLMLFFSLRQDSYLYYVAYILCFGLLQTAIAGLNAQYLWPDATEWNNTSIPFFMGASCLFAVLFTRRFLSTALHYPRTDSLLKLMAIVCACHALASFLLSYQLALTSGNILTILITAALLSTGILAVVNGSPGAQYFLCGWTLLLIGSTIFVLVSSGIIPPNVFTENAARYGSAAEALLLALALGEKIKDFREERNRVAMNAREDLRAGNYELSMGLAQLQRSDQLKDEFLAKVSHELRTPLNGILGSLELMKLEELPAAVEEYAQSANVSAEHMLELVNTLLSFSEARGKNTYSADELIDVRNLIDTLGDNYASQLAEKELRLVVTVGEEVPILLLGDSSKLRLILSQLMDNAIKYSTKCNINISATAIKLSIDSSRIEFVLEDCGIGISRENLEAVFDPFFTRGASSDQQTGLGMGLAISKQLVGRMHGDIRAEESDVGARIKLELPFKLPKDASS